MEKGTDAVNGFNSFSLTLCDRRTRMHRHRHTRTRITSLGISAAEEPHSGLIHHIFWRAQARNLLQPAHFLKTQDILAVLKACLPHRISPFRV